MLDFANPSPAHPGLALRQLVLQRTRRLRVHLRDDASSRSRNP